jgi:hypothetical protein
MFHKARPVVSVVEPDTSNISNNNVKQKQQKAASCEKVFTTRLVEEGEWSKISSSTKRKTATKVTPLLAHNTTASTTSKSLSTVLRQTPNAIDNGKLSVASCYITIIDPFQSRFPAGFIHFI